MAHAATAPSHSHAEEFDAHGHKGHGHVIVSIWTLRAVLLTLLFFTLLTSGAAVAEEWISATFHMEIPQWVNAAVALSIAVVKTTLVVMFFMQLKYDNPLNTMIFIFTILTVGFFLGFTSLDVGQRQTIDRFKAGYIHQGGSLGMGGTSPYVAQRIQRLQDKVAQVKGPAVPTDISLVDLAKLEEQYGLREPHHAAHTHEAENALAVDSGYRREQPAMGSSEQRSRPIKGLTLPEFAPAQPAGAHDVHDPSASGGQPAGEHKPEAAPAKQQAPGAARPCGCMNKAWIVTLVSAAAFVGGAVPMAQRISTFNKDAHLASFHIEPFASRKIRLEGFPPVEIQDRPALPDERLPPDAFFLKVIYGEPPHASETLVPVHKPPAPDIPKLDIYEEWAKLLAINEVQRDAAGNPHVKPGSEHLVLAVRRTPQGFDADTWGSVRRTEWLFDFYELKPDGTIARQTYRWPMDNPMYEEAFQKRAAEAAAGAEGKPPDLRLKSIADIPVLPERGYIFQAALHVIPKLAVPKYKFNDTAFSFHTLGWTLPVVMLSGLAFSVAVFFAIAPATTKRERPEAAAPARD